MIYLNRNIINKIGNSNRLYYNGSIVYQGYTTGGDEPDIPDSEYSLPDVPFMFNFNAKQYNNGVMPNANGALFAYDCTLSDTSVVDYNGDYLTFNGDGNFSYRYSNDADNPFNRTGNDPLTIVMKTRTSNIGSDNHPLANRGVLHYNWMCRIGDGYQWLHTYNNSYSNSIAVPYTYDSENIVAIRCLNDGNGYAQNYTTGEYGDIVMTSWGNACNEINIFDGGYSVEIFLGDFYWMYCSLEQLTDEQIKQVIEYNENKAFEPVVPDVPPVEPEPDEPEVVIEDWSVIGDINGEYWAEDVPMTYEDGKYIARDIYFNEVIGEFKLRKDGNWAVQCGANYSADYKNVGDILSGINSASSPNFKIYNVVGTPYTIYFDNKNYEVIVEGLLPDEPYVPPVVVDTWGVIGDLDIGLWSAEVDMVKEGDNYVARDVIFANAEGYGCCFKIRKNDSWSENYGGFGSAYYLGDEIPLDSSGDNILIVDAIVGEPYTITFNPTNLTIIVN